MFKKIFNNVITPACVFYTVISLFVALTSFTLDKNIPALPTSNILIIAAYSLILAILNLIFKIKALDVYIRIPLHYIASTLSLFLVLFIAAGDLVTNTNNIRFVLLVLYTILYITSVVVFICIRETRKNKKPKEGSEKEYTGIYKK